MYKIIIGNIAIACGFVVGSYIFVQNAPFESKTLQTIYNIAAPVIEPIWISHEFRGQSFIAIPQWTDFVVLNVNEISAKIQPNPNIYKLIRLLKIHFDDIGVNSPTSFASEDHVVFVYRPQQINRQGLPLSGQAEFAPQIMIDSSRGWGRRFFEAVFISPEGRWRMICVVISPYAATSDGRTLSFSEAVRMHHSGLIGDFVSFDKFERTALEEMNITVFLYEWSKRSRNAPAIFELNPRRKLLDILNEGPFEAYISHEFLQSRR